MFKTTKAKVISVVVFCVICISVTLGLILYKNIEIEDETGINESTLGNEGKEKDVAGIDLKGTYNQNDIKIEQKTATKEKVEVSYCQIYGLKDKIIQDSINKELEKVALNCYKEKITDLNEVINVSVNMWNLANFSNTLSFVIDYVAKIDDDGDGFYQGYKGLNYDLTTGEKITVDKLFTSDAPIENILRRSAYYSLAQNNLEDNLSGDFVISDYGDIEGEIIKIIDLYKRGKITEFYFGPKSITMYYDENKYIIVNMQENAEYIAIYNRYLVDETIYETNNVGLKNLYTLTERYTDDNYRYTNYEKGKNYFIDITIDAWDENEASKNLQQTKINDIKAEIEKVKAYANKNSDNFYILNYYINIYTSTIYTTADHSTEENLTTCYERGNSYEMTTHDFEENVEPIIIEYNREDSGGGIPDYVYDFTDVLKIEPQETNEYYKPETGEKIVI